MMLNKLLVVSTISLSALSMTYANADELSKHYENCMDKAGGVTMKMHTCISSETQRQDARLNQAYKTLTAKLNATRKKELLEAQRTWIKFRDQNCKFYVDPNGGSLAGINGSICIIHTTASRADELENFIN